MNEGEQLRMETNRHVAYETYLGPRIQLVEALVRAGYPRSHADWSGGSGSDVRT